VSKLHSAIDDCLDITSVTNNHHLQYVKSRRRADICARYFSGAK